MARITNLYWLHAITPLHIGVGQGVGFIDLPIMREKVTNWPMIPGSSIKGVLSDHHDASREGSRENNDILKAAFGVSGSEHSNSGSLVITDARIVCFPVRSLYGTFAWVTSPLVLGRLKRNLVSAGLDEGIDEIPQPVGGEIHTPKGMTSVLRDADGSVYFEDLDFRAKGCAATRVWYDKLAGWIFPEYNTQWREIFAARFAVISDDTFNFLCEMATEVSTRIRIDPDKKIVKPGQLWTEESLPAEAILSGMVWCDKVYVENVTAESLVEKFCTAPETLQIGGKATIGKGQVRITFEGGGGYVG